MADYKIVPDIQFNDNYAQAKKDLIQALNSIQKLTMGQRKALASELFGAELVNNFVKIMQNASEKQ